MAITELIEVIRITEHGCLEVRKTTLDIVNGEEISRSYHRHVVSPGDNLLNEDPAVKAVGDIVHTQAVIDAFAQALIDATP